MISRKGSPNIKGLGKLRHVVEQTFASLNPREGRYHVAEHRM
ncbi:hypothetical protein [Streptomyces fagopyri]